jgi:hypothetical protein
MRGLAVANSCPSVASSDQQQATSSRQKSPVVVSCRGHHRFMVLTRTLALATQVQPRVRASGPRCGSEAPRR